MEVGTVLGIEEFPAMFGPCSELGVVLSYRANIYTSCNVTWSIVAILTEAIVATHLYPNYVTLYLSRFMWAELGIQLGLHSARTSPVNEVDPPKGNDIMPMGRVIGDC
mgnify:CR=1 FL=1